MDVSIDHVLNGHDPFSAVSVDRIWNSQRANDSAEKFSAIACGTGQPNLLRDLLSPCPLRQNIRNWPEVTRALFRLRDLEDARWPNDDEGRPYWVSCQTCHALLLPSQIVRKSITHWSFPSSCLSMVSN
ncbi:MAG: hypothetical protein GVY36_19835 [Verrucomicrobia bacterium]|nr:hypothetical protein [Verrucomicrobiota bacterium]